MFIEYHVSLGFHLIPGCEDENKNKFMMELKLSLEWNHLCNFYFNEQAAEDLCAEFLCDDAGRPFAGTPVKWWKRVVNKQKWNWLNYDVIRRINLTLAFEQSSHENGLKPKGTSRN